MDKPYIRRRFRKYRQIIKGLELDNFWLQSHKARDMADLETRLGELEAERDFYKNNGHGRTR